MSHFAIYLCRGLILEVTGVLRAAALQPSVDYHLPSSVVIPCRG
jgi:hypothetical protein